jgi:hypothetical protein
VLQHLHSQQARSRCVIQRQRPHNAVQRARSTGSGGYRSRVRHPCRGILPGGKLLAVLQQARHILARPFLQPRQGVRGIRVGVLVWWLVLAHAGVLANAWINWPIQRIASQ